MRYISQLTDGYMLVSSDDGEKFKVKKVGYPYKNTEFPSSVMLDDLLIDLGIKDRARVQTVSDLIEVLRDSYNSGTQYTKREMCQLLEYGFIDEFSFALFECKYFSVYSITDIFASPFYESIKDYIVWLGSSNKYTKSIYVLHWHKGVSEDSTLPRLQGLSSTFSSLVYSITKMHLDEFKFCLDLIYDNLGRLGLDDILFSSETVYESFQAFPISNSEINSNSKQLKSIALEVIARFKFFDMYIKSDNEDNIVRRAFKEIYGYDLFSVVRSYNTMAPFSFKLGLLCGAYPFLKQNEKERYRGTIKEESIQLAVTAGFGNAKMFYTIRDGDIIVLTSPYISLLSDINRMGLLQEDEIGLIDLDEKQKVFGFNLGKTVKGLLQGIEYKLYQYFRLIRLSSSSPYIIKYYPESNEESDNAWFSYRKVLKAIVPNFDRLYLFGAYTSTSMVDILEQYYYLYDINSTYYTVASDFALDGSFSEEEKSFILMLGSLNHLGKSIFRSEDDRVAPVISEDFVKRLEVVFKIGSIVFQSNTVEDVLNLLRNKVFMYNYKNYVFNYSWV